MQVIDLLLQHLLGDDLLGMEPFLPDLVLALSLGRLLIILQLIQEPGFLILPQQGDKALGSVTFKIPDCICEAWSGHHQVQMVVQDDIGVNLQVFVLATELEGVDEQVEIGFPGEKGEPIDHGTGDEVGVVRLSDGVAGSHGARWL